MGEQTFIQKWVIVAVLIIFLLPVLIGMFFPKETDSGEVLNTNVSEYTMQDLTDSYFAFTGARGSTTEMPWSLTGIYTPYTGGNYNYTADGWLYGELIKEYHPSQYDVTAQVQSDNPDKYPAITESSRYLVKYQVDYDGARVYRYSLSNEGTQETPSFYYLPDGTQDGKKNRDLYTYVTMDVNQQSDVFFTSNLKQKSNQYFYYEYTGYRYAFQPLSDYYMQGTNGEPIRTTATNTSLSLIWYNFVGQSGISGQLVLTGSDSGVDYITAPEIVTAFNSVNNTAKFIMNFNGCEMNIYIRINPYYTSQGWSIEDCYNNGWWSIMVTSVTADMTAYTTPSNPINIEKIWETLMDLFTFNMQDYPLSPTMQIFTSIVITGVLYTTLIAIVAHNPKLLIIVGLIALIQTVTSFLTDGINLDWGLW